METKNGPGGFYSIMKTKLFIALVGLSAIIIFAQQAFPNAAPQYPLNRTEVKNPGEWLRMESEVVDVTVGAQTTHVSAKFHFVLAKPNVQNILDMRLGFPELSADQPLERVHVHQTILPLNRYYDNHPQITMNDHPTDEPSKKMNVKRWFTWPLEVPATFRYNGPEGVNIEVTYDQKLRHTRGNVSQSTYVLRTGALWSGDIASSIVNLHLQDGVQFVKATPSKYQADHNTITFTFKNWKPDTDVTFWVKSKS